MSDIPSKRMESPTNQQRPIQIRRRVRTHTNNLNLTYIMKLATIGVGNAATKIVDRMLEFEQETNRTLCRHVLAINTARTDLAKPEFIPEHRRILVGDTHQKAKGHDVGGDIDVGADVAKIRY